MQAYPLNKVNTRRILEHILFWIASLFLLTIYFGNNKPSYLWSLFDNLLYLPIHIIYFYVLAYWLMPHMLYKKKYVAFFTVLVFCILTSAFITRILDILIIDPRVYAEYKKIDPTFTWDKLSGSFFDQLFNERYFSNALKGSNLIIWTALTIKFFKMWHERKQAALEAELNFLKGQIHPHFLFNTLNNLYSLTLTKSDKTPAIVMGLSEILRYMLYESKTDTITLSRDVKILENYIALEKLRYEERLELNLNVSDKISNHQIAPLLLLPLVENAFKHGASEQLGEAWINIDINVKNDVLKFKVSNGLPAQGTSSVEVHKGNIGLANVKKRLEIMYPNAHELKIFKEEDMFVVIMEVNLYKYAAI